MIRIGIALSMFALTSTVSADSFHPDARKIEAYLRATGESLGELVIDGNTVLVRLVGVETRANNEYAIIVKLEH